MSLRFEEPPPKGGFDYASIAAELLERRGEWAHLATFENYAAAAAAGRTVRTGNAAAFRPAGTFEATQRGCDLWIRARNMTPAEALAALDDVLAAER